MTIGHTAAPYVRIVMDDGLAHEIGAQHRHSCPRPHGGSGAPIASADIGVIAVPSGSRACGPTGEAGAPNLSTPGAVAGEAQSVGSAGESYSLEVTTPLARILSHKTAPTAAKPWGNQPLCPVCNRGKLYSCICNVPEPEPEYFKPGINRDPDWHRIEL